MAGCAGGSGRPGDEGSTLPTGVSLSGPTGADGSEGDEGDDQSNDDDMILDVGGVVDDSGPDTGDECEEVIEDAMVGAQPADIIIVIDNSVSMGNEIANVQANMNAFSSQIVLANIDVHVIMISGFEHNSDSGICVPPPLGSGMCPTDDHNPPGYWRVGNWVGSHSALQRVVGHYADYSPALRPTASTHVVVVTDDNSDWSAPQFTTDFTALNPNFSEFILHAIINGSGSVYSQLATETGGLVSDINGQYTTIFDQLADSVIETISLACEFEIPEPSGGEILNPDKVNVEFADGAGGTLEIGRVDDPSLCPGVMDGWYYDNPADPQMILLCDQTCDRIQGYALATISVIFGCDTIPAG